MPPQQVTTEQLDKVLSFKGFGEPTGRFWFFGLEDGASKDDDEAKIASELRKRSEFSEFQDLTETMTQFGSTIGHATAQTWLNMGRIIRCVTRQPDWNSLRAAQEYKNTHLGRTGGETLLAELLPLSAPNTGSWRYDFLGRWKTRDEYSAEQIPLRIELLRELFQNYYVPNRLRFIICYGKGHWPNFRQVFRLADGTAPRFEPELLRGEHRFEIGVLGQTRIALVPFLGRGYRGDVWGPNYILISELAEALLREEQSS